MEIFKDGRNVLQISNRKSPAKHWRFLLKLFVFIFFPKFNIVHDCLHCAFNPKLCTVDTKIIAFCIAPLFVGVIVVVACTSFIFFDNQQPLFHFSLSTLLLPQGSLHHPRSQYLNHRCISFENGFAVPFTSSFAVQLLCFNPSFMYPRLFIYYYIESQIKKKTFIVFNNKQLKKN